MCNLLSGFINIKTQQPEIADLRSHSKTQELLKWTPKDISLRREWEWTVDDTGKSLIVRVAPDDPKELADNLRAALLVRWPNRVDAIRECAVIAATNGGYLYLSGCDLKGIKLPTSVGGYLELSGCDLKGIKLPTSVGGYLELRGCDLKGIKLPTSVGGSLELSGCDLKGIKLPTSVGGYLELSGCDLKGIKLPTSVGGTLYLRDGGAGLRGTQR